MILILIKIVVVLFELKHAYVKQDWGIIRNAVRSGSLGPCRVAKVSTMRPSPLARTDDSKVICIYTSDDERERRHVRDRLRELGVVKSIPWKSDKDTDDGKYGGKAHCIHSD